MESDPPVSTHPVYSPSSVAAKDLATMTIGRHDLFERLKTRIKSAATDGSRPHTLLVGPRGSGKTHTLRVAIHQALSLPGVSDGVLPIFIPEDSLAIGSYADLLVEAIRPLAQADLTTARKLRRGGDVVALERTILDAAAGRMIILALENLDRVFAAIGKGGQGSLRAWVESSTAVMVFATTPSLFSGVSSRTLPWYGSFIIENLPDVTLDEGAEMLSSAAGARGDSALAEFVLSPEGRDRLKVIHRLAGGSPRLWHIVADCVDIQALDELVPAVEKLLDLLSPYYQQRLWQLPASEQRLVIELARGWEPRTVSDLSAVVGATSQTTSASLGRLTESRWVTSNKADTGDKRLTWYDLAEPLLRYYLHYREDDGEPLRLVVEFLRGFYPSERLMAELAHSIPDSPLEKHLVRALEQGNDSWRLINYDGNIDDILAHMRLWTNDMKHGVARVGIMLEAIVNAATNRQFARRVPDDLEGRVRTATAATLNCQGSIIEKIAAGLKVASAGDWTSDEEDALLEFELAVTPLEPENRRKRVAESPAVVGHRLTERALVLRYMYAVQLEGEATIQEIDTILDELHAADGHIHQRIVNRQIWCKLVPSTARVPARDIDPELGVAVLFNLASGINTPEQLHSIFTVLSPMDRAVLAVAIDTAPQAMRGRLPKDLDVYTYLPQGEQAEARQLAARARQREGLTNPRR